MKVTLYVPTTQVFQINVTVISQRAFLGLLQRQTEMCEINSYSSFSKSNLSLLLNWIGGSYSALKMEPAAENVEKRNLHALPRKE